MTPVWRPAVLVSGEGWLLAREAGEHIQTGDTSLASAQAVADQLNEEEAERDWEAHNMIEIDAGRYAE